MSGLEIALIGGMVASAGSQIAGGFMKKAAARRTAQRLRADAEERQRVGAIEAEAIFEDGRRAEGAALAQAGASGFTADDSVNDAIAGLARASATDAQNARYTAARDAKRMKTEAAETQAQGTAALITGGMNAAGSLLTGYASGKQAGAFGG